MSQQISKIDLAKIKAARWKARTDLIFLCREILGYEDVDEVVHGPLVAALQKFPEPDPDLFWENDKFVRGEWIYRPLVPIQQLKGKRRVLILDPRGHLKTTINVIAHTIQWIINYPDVAILIVQANTEKAILCLDEIKKHFQGNPRFRALFPEHCPTKKVYDWGTQTDFTTAARSPGVVRKEKTVMTASIEKGTAGLHFDVIKFSDIVEDNNSRTPEQCAAVARSFYLMENLLVSPGYWIDVEGTRYHHADLYGKIIEKEWKNKPPEKRAYHVHVRGCFKKKTPDGGPQKFTPDELEYPDLLDETGKRVPWWPKDRRGNDRFPLALLEDMEARDPYIFSCQQRNYPSSGIGQQVFPVNDQYPKWISREDFEKNVRVAYYDISVDTAETDGKESNYSSIAVGAWSSYGKCYVVEIVHGKFLADELVRRIIDTAMKYYRSLASIKIEQTSYVRGLMSSLRRKMDLSGLYLPVDLITRDTRKSKIERITSTLQPWYKHGDLIFLLDIGPKDHLLKELKEFPLGESDDILDSLADLFQNKPWFGREIPRPSLQQAMNDEMARFLGVEDPFRENEYIVPIPGGEDPYRRTGGL